MSLIGRDGIEAFVSIFVTLLPHELSALLYSSSTFFFVSIHSFILNIFLSFPFLTMNLMIYADFECILCGSSFT